MKRNESRHGANHRYYILNRSVFLHSTAAGNFSPLLLTVVLLCAVLTSAALAVQQSIDISYPLGSQQQTRRMLLQRSIDGTCGRTDRRTDTVPFHRPCRINAPCCMPCVSAKEEMSCCYMNPVKVFSNGTCHWYREYQLSITHCPIDIAWFPFDDQVCELIYESKTHESRELNFTRSSRDVELAFYIHSGEWNLLGT